MLVVFMGCFVKNQAFQFLPHGQSFLGIPLHFLSLLPDEKGVKSLLMQGTALLWWWLATTSRGIIIVKLDSSELVLQIFIDFYVVAFIFVAHNFFHLYSVRSSACDINRCHICPQV